MYLPARILSSSDPLALASGSLRRPTMQSVRRCQQSTCRWSESCPSRTEARSCTARSNSQQQCTTWTCRRFWHSVWSLTLPSQWHQFHWTCRVRNSTELRGRRLHHQPESSSPFCQLQRLNRLVKSCDNMHPPQDHPPHSIHLQFVWMLIQFKVDLTILLVFWIFGLFIDI